VNTTAQTPVRNPDYPGESLNNAAIRHFGVDAYKVSDLEQPPPEKSPSLSLGFQTGGLGVSWRHPDGKIEICSLEMGAAQVLSFSGLDSTEAERPSDESPLLLSAG
jgi:hypothetical protein